MFPSPQLDYFTCEALIFRSLGVLASVLASVSRGVSPGVSPDVHAAHWSSGAGYLHRMGPTRLLATDTRYCVHRAQRTVAELRGHLLMERCTRMNTLLQHMTHCEKATYNW